MDTKYMDNIYWELASYRAGEIISFRVVMTFMMPLFALHV